MNVSRYLIPALIATALTARAEVPKQPRLTDYAPLWTDSPFTADPPPPEQEAPDNPLDDYTLGGISRLADGYYAILLNAQNPEERIIVSADSPDEKGREFEILEVKWSDASWRETVVVLKHGSYRGTVTFEDKAIALKKTPQQQEQQQEQQNAQPPTPQQGNQGNARQPRPRVVVPNNNNNNNNRRGGNNRGNR